FQIKAWQRIEGVTLVGVADLSAKARAALADLGVETFETASDLLDQGLDILDIATPPQTHADLVRLGLGRAVAVICQKPFGQDLATARDLVAEAGDTPLFVHENFRFQPWYREIARLLADGLIGDVVQARFALRPGDGVGPEAYLSRQPYFQRMERFLIHETAIHFIDTFRYLFGELRTVYADLRRCNPVIAGEDAGLVIFEGERGVRLTFDGNRTLDMPATNPRLTLGLLEVEGSQGALRLDGDGGLWHRARGARWQAVPFVFEDVDFGGNCVEAFQRHVLAALQGGKAETYARDYLINQEIEEVVYRSAARGARLPLPVPGGGTT
ncbi:MAG: Gfo/Idh/MocA family oxidoreductase, partial [Pseudomonadota bacterium]